jgi:hypothetical protein
MINAICNVHPVNVPHSQQKAEVVRPETEKQTPPVAKSGEVSPDQVTLRQAGDRKQEG